MQSALTNELIISALKRIRTPKYIILFVNEDCPNNCLHCWFKPLVKAGHEKYLTVPDYIKLAQNARSISFLSITGGEAFLRDELEDIVAAFEEHCFVKRMDIPTSGFDSSRILEKVEKLLKIRKGPLRIDVSIDGAENTHDLIRGRKGSFSEAVNTIKKLRLLQHKYSNLDIAVITTLSSYNQDEIDEISAIVEEILPSGEWMLNIIRPPVKDEKALDVEPENFIYASDLIFKRIRARNFIGDRGHKLGKMLTAKNITRRNIIASHLKGKRQELVCSAGTYTGVISATGDVFICETILKPVGNLREKALDDIWHSYEKERQLDNALKSKCSCTHECFLSTNILVNPSCWPSLMKNRITL